MNFCTLCIPEVLLKNIKQKFKLFIYCLHYSVSNVWCVINILMVISLAFMHSYLNIFQLESLIAIKVIIG